MVVSVCVNPMCALVAPITLWTCRVGSQRRGKGLNLGGGMLDCWPERC